MKAWLKVTLCIVLSFMCLFSCVGYAALSDTISVKGFARTDIPSGLFITKVVTTGSSRVDKNEVSFLDYSTTVDSTISRSSWSLS